MQPWHTLFPVWNQSVLPVASWTAYGFRRRQVRWSGIPISLRIFQSLLWSAQWKALALSIKQKQMFFWNSCIFDDPTVVGNLIFGSSVFSKSSLNICKFKVLVLLMIGLENFVHYFATVWDECNCAVVWAFFVSLMLSKFYLNYCF